MKIRPLGAELFHADGQTDRQAWLSYTFHNFVNAPKNIIIKIQISYTELPKSLYQIIQVYTNLTLCEHILYSKPRWCLVYKPS
jgi:hypothetical protein